MDGSLQQRQVIVDLLGGRVVLQRRIVVRTHRCEREALDTIRPRWLVRRSIEQGPRRNRQEGDQDRDEDIA